MTKDKYVNIVTQLIDEIIANTKELAKIENMDERLVGKEYKDNMTSNITTSINTIKAKLVSEFLNNYNKNYYY